MFSREAKGWMISTIGALVCVIPMLIPAPSSAEPVPVPVIAIDGGTTYIDGAACAQSNMGSCSQCIQIVTMMEMGTSNAIQDHAAISNLS